MTHELLALRLRRAFRQPFQGGGGFVTDVASVIATGQPLQQLPGWLRTDVLQYADCAQALERIRRPNLAFDVCQEHVRTEG